MKRLFLATLLAALCLLLPQPTQAETVLYALDFNNAPLGAFPGTATGARVVPDQGNPVLELSGANAQLALPRVTLPEYARGHQNPTLITFNVKWDTLERFRLVGTFGSQPVVFAELRGRGALYDGAAAPQLRGTLKPDTWYNVYLNIDPSFAGFYISFTAPDGSRTEYRRRVPLPSYDVTLAFSAAAPKGHLWLDNLRGLTGFGLDKTNLKSQYPPGDSYEPETITTVLTLTPGSPDMTLRRGTLWETYKLAVAPSTAGGSILVPIRAVFQALGAQVRWERAPRRLTAQYEGLDLQITPGSKEALVNGKKLTLEQPTRLALEDMLAPLSLLRQSPALKVELAETGHRLTLTDGQVRKRHSTKIVNDSTLKYDEVIVGAVPPTEPRAPVALTYTFTNPNASKRGLTWTETAFAETPDWHPAASYLALQQRMIAEGRREVWIRFSATTTPENYNNTYFTLKHEGTVTFYQNGALLRGNVTGKGDLWLRTFNYITRKDNIGTPSQYGVYYKAGKVPLLDIELVRGASAKPAELRNAGTIRGTSKALAPQFPLVLDIPHMRDPQCIRGSDGYYYLVGTPFLHGSIPYARGINEGIELFRSQSRSGPFESMGYVWRFDTARWANTRYFTADQERNIWAPEIHELGGKWYLVYFPTRFPKAGLEGYSQFQIGIAVADNPLGPYHDTSATPLVSAPDPHLFRDDDGATYLTYGNGHIVRLKPTLDGLADRPRMIYPSNAQSVCNEGSTLFKVKGKYFFGGAFSNHYFDESGKYLDQTYDCELAMADHIYGPYGERFVGLKNAGNNSFFQDTDGKWYATIWQPSKRIGIVQVEQAADGKWRPAERYEVISPKVRY